jgi:BolA protein
MNAEIQIKEKLLNNLGLKDVQVINNSHLHQSHAQSPNSGISHFKLIIKDEELNKLPKIKSHQKIYSCLSDEMKSFIHALEIEIISV